MIDAEDWYVAQMRPHGLKRAVDHLFRQGFPTFCPKQRVSYVNAGKQIEALRPLFPGYLFVSFDQSDLRWTAINSTRGVARLILNDPRRPAPLPCPLMAGLMARCDGSGVLLPPDDLAVGDRVRILSGPFAETVTTIEDLPEPARIGVLIELMGRRVRTTLPHDQIEKLA